MVEANVFENFKGCTIAKFHNLFDSLRVYGVSYTYESTGFYQGIKMAPTASLEDGGPVAVFHLSLTNQSDVDVPGLEEEGTRPDIDTVGFVKYPVHDGDVLPNLPVDIEIRFHKEDAKYSFKTFRFNGRLFTIARVVETRNLNTDNAAFHQLFLLFADKEYLNVFHAIGLNQRLTKQTTLNIFDLLDSGGKGRVIGQNIEAVNFSVNEGHSVVTSLFPRISDISFVWIKGIPSMVITTDTGVITLDKGAFNKLTYSEIIPVIANGVTRYHWTVHFSDHMQLDILFF